VPTQGTWYGNQSPNTVTRAPGVEPGGTRRPGLYKPVPYA